MHRLVITLHVDAFNMAVGGGITWYDMYGRRLACKVWPGLPHGERTVEEAARWLAGEGVTERARQLTLW